MWRPLLQGRTFRLGFWALVLGVAVLSLLPGEYLPPVTATIWDKAQHASAFTVLGAWGMLVYPRRPWSVLLGLLAFGGAIELAQATTTWRFGDWQDWLADAVGLTLGAVLAWWPSRRLALRGMQAR